MLQRQEILLKMIINDYVATAQPVPSEVLARNYPQGISSATVRNEMAHLEAEGYIRRPHTSAGSIPTDKGYRYYVEALENIGELPPPEQQLIHHLFYEVEKQLEEWVRLAAALSARLTQYAAVVSTPKAPQSRWHHLELIALQEFLALLVLVLREAKIKEQLLSFEQAITQEDLNVLSRKLNDAFSGLSCPQISARGTVLPPAEKQVVQAVVNLMEEEDKREYAEPHLEGLRGMLKQPEFIRRETVTNLLDIIEGKQLLKAILSQLPQQPGVQVIIGEENREESLRSLSVVVTHYGIPSQAMGTIAVVGPTRMRYGHTIATVHHLAGVLSGLLSQLHGHGYFHRTN